MPVLVSLQWGRERVLAEIVDSRMAHRDIFHASMGPRARARGNAVLSIRTEQSIPGFNGAASACSRKLDAEVGIDSCAVPLQWGRERVLAEITRAAFG